MHAYQHSGPKAVRPVPAADLLAAMDEEVASGPQEPAEEEDAAIPASAAPPQDLVPQAVTTLLIPPAPQPDAANLLAPAAVLDTAEDCEDVAPRAASIPPSPNRHAMLGGRQAQLEELLELQARFAAMKPRGGACAGQGQVSRAWQQEVGCQFTLHCNMWDGNSCSSGGHASAGMTCAAPHPIPRCRRPHLLPPSLQPRPLLRLQQPPRPRRRRRPAPQGPSLALPTRASPPSAWEPSAPQPSTLPMCFQTLRSLPAAAARLRYRPPPAGTRCVAQPRPKGPPSCQPARCSLGLTQLAAAATQKPVLRGTAAGRAGTRPTLPSSRAAAAPGCSALCAHATTAQTSCTPRCRARGSGWQAPRRLTPAPPPV